MDDDALKLFWYAAMENFSGYLAVTNVEEVQRDRHKPKTEKIA